MLRNYIWGCSYRYYMYILYMLLYTLYVIYIITRPNIIPQHSSLEMARMEEAKHVSRVGFWFFPAK